MIDIEELAKRLSIEIDFNEGGRAYWAGDHILKVSLWLDGEVISTSQTSIPNNDREDAY